MLIPLFFLFSFINVFAKEDKQFRIEGSTQSVRDGESVMLFSFKGNEIVGVDTAIIQKGAFGFKGNEYIDELSLLVSGNYPGKVIYKELVLEKGNIIVRFDSISRVGNTPLNNILQFYLDSCGYYHNKIRDLIKKRENRSDNSEYNLLIYNEDVKYRDFRCKFKKENIANIIGQWAFIQGFNYLNDPCFDEIYALSDEKFKTLPAVVSALKAKKEYEQRQEVKLKNLQNYFIDFELQTAEGQTKKLSDYVGKSKYLFIDFWASWCGPCIEDMPHLKEVYQTYKKDGLEIIGISLDRTNHDWERGLKRVDVSWNQLLIPEDVRDDFKKAYGIQEIPYGILLNEKGAIIKVNLKSDSLKLYMESGGEAN